MPLLPWNTIMQCKERDFIFCKVVVVVVGNK